MNHAPWQIETSGVPVFDEAGKLIGYRGIDRDVTDRKKAEILLEEKNERLRLALEASLMGTWDWNIQNDLVDWSPETMKIFGTNPYDFEGN